MLLHLGICFPGFSQTTTPDLTPARTPADGWVSDFRLLSRDGTTVAVEWTAVKEADFDLYISQSCEKGGYLSSGNSATGKVTPGQRITSEILSIDLAEGDNFAILCLYRNNLLEYSLRFFFQKDSRVPDVWLTINERQNPEFRCRDAAAVAGAKTGDCARVEWSGGESETKVGERSRTNAMAFSGRTPGRAEFTAEKELEYVIRYRAYDKNRNVSDWKEEAVRFWNFYRISSEAGLLTPGGQLAQSVSYGFWGRFAVEKGLDSLATDDMGNYKFNQWHIPGLRSEFLFLGGNKNKSNFTGYALMAGVSWPLPVSEASLYFKPSVTAGFSYLKTFHNSLEYSGVTPAISAGLALELHLGFFKWLTSFNYIRFADDILQGAASISAGILMHF